MSNRNRMSNANGVDPLDLQFPLEHYGCVRFSGASCDSG
jgi:hypothetical protein